MCFNIVRKVYYADCPITPNIDQVLMSHCQRNITLLGKKIKIHPENIFTKAGKIKTHYENKTGQSKNYKKT